MCGATSEQKSLAASQTAFYNQMTEQYKAVFGAQQAILKALTDKFTPILNAGPGQRGFSDEERTDLETDATTSNATNFANAKRALQQNLAARGGNDFLPSGADAQLEGGLEGTAAAEESNLRRTINETDYNVGRENWLTAVNALGKTAELENPAGFANSATNAGSAAGTTDNQIAAADNSIWNSVIGGVSGIAGAALGGWTSAIGKKAKPAADAGVPA